MTSSIKIIPKICHITKDPLLFLPESPVNNPAYIGYYAHIGQHGDASLDFYRKCKNPETEQEKQEVNALLQEYQSIC